MIDLKVSNVENITKIIPHIRRYNKELSIGEIKKRIENHDVLITHDVAAYVDICDELNNLDKNEEFLKLIDKLTEAGSEVEFYEDGTQITYQFVCNLIQRWREIGEETELDIQRELGECDE